MLIRLSGSDIRTKCSRSFLKWITLDYISARAGLDAAHAELRTRLLLKEVA
jgi:hypothetical protein